MGPWRIFLMLLSNHGSTIGLSPQTPNFTQNDDARCVAAHTSQKGATLETTTQFEAVKISDRAPVESRQSRHVHGGGQSMIYCDRYHYHQYTDHRFSSFLSWLGEEIEKYFIIVDVDNPMLVLFITCFCPFQNLRFCLFTVMLSSRALSLSLFLSFNKRYLPNSLHDS